MEEGKKMITILGREVEEEGLRKNLREILNMRDISAELIVRPRAVDDPGIRDRPDPRAFYKYAFFDCIG